MIENRLHMWIIAGSILAAVIVVCGLLAAVVSVQRQFPTDAAGLYRLHPDQCEHPRANSAVSEPENTWTNLAYLLAGLLVLMRARSVPGILFGANLCILAFGSALYHATVRPMPPGVTSVEQIMDVVWVYAALFSLIVFSTYSLLRAIGRPAPWWAWVIAVILLDILSFLIRKVFVWDSDVVFGVLIVILLVLVCVTWWQSWDRTKHGGDLRTWLEFVAVLTVATLGIVFRLLDGYHSGAFQPKAFCWPHSPIQAHAVWHVFSAAALLLTYDFLAQRQKGQEWNADRPCLYPD